ncbi:hypothetical protein VPNG_05282 [Cytospora leucostoma]|uniref:Xylanolytic transcriptional activator regulatory domain-containing protein n=1 Tax=Cytospora leucostoma TaxID=1230097 RepID=A0A423X7U4_9PEZI|nr:hypothetical protein VPNG_05282 [Cytospora leucostoma]
MDLWGDAQKLPQTPSQDPKPGLESDFITAMATRIDTTTDWVHGGISWSAMDQSTILQSTSDAGLLSPAQSPTAKLSDLAIPDLAWADLDQLYFDRVHPVAPIVHTQRYLAWAGEGNPPMVRACLRMAMRTAASAVSAQFRHLSNAIYSETRRMLETLDASEHDNDQGLPWMTTVEVSKEIHLEQIQAWLLLVHYEILCMSGHLASLTAARALRLVRLLRLYDVDASDVPAPSPATIGSGKGFAETEEKRRTFWLAFSFDRLFSTMCEWSMTLHEEIIRTRLPAPEENFQKDQPIRMDFLPEAINKDGQSSALLSPFAECMVLATLHGRSITHKQLALSAIGSAKDTRDFWARHEWLAAEVEKHTQLLESWRQNSAGTSTSDLVDGNPMLLFTNILAHDTIVYLSNVTETIAWDDVGHQLISASYKQRGIQAASEVVRLAHPFLPGALSRAATCLMMQIRTGEISTPGNEIDAGIEKLLDTLRRMMEINNMARKYLHNLEGKPDAVSRGLNC